MRIRFAISLTVILFLFIGGGCMAQVAPATRKAIAQTLPVTGRQWVVDQMNPRADDAGAGTAEQPFKTIAPAAAAAQPGDTVLVKAGIYREQITPDRGGEKDRPITYLAEPGHNVIVLGSEVWNTNWRDEGQGIFFASFDSPLFSHGNPFLKELFKPHSNHGIQRPRFPEHHSLGQLFVNGNELTEVKQRDQLNKSAGTWLVQSDGLLVHFPVGIVPGKAQVETSIRPSLFAPRQGGVNYIHVSGFVFKRCAGDAVSTRTGRGWVIENNVIGHARNKGIIVGSDYSLSKTLDVVNPDNQPLKFGGDSLIRGNTVSDCGVVGIGGWSEHRTRIIGNIVERNNTIGVHNQEVQAGIKFTAGTDLLFEGNLVRDNNAWGIWLDGGCNHCRVTRNTIIANASGGVFVELGNGGTMVDHNLIGLSRPFLGHPDEGYGIYTHDTSGVILANNLIWGNSAQAIMMRTVSTRIVPHGIPGALVQTSNMQVLNNIIVGESAISLPCPNPRSQGNRSDWNLFVADQPHFTINWTQISKADQERDKQQFGLSSDMVNLNRWRSLFSTESHSVIEPGLTVQYDPVTLSLTITVPPTGIALRCPPVPGLDRDFQGKVYPAGEVMPGPFINLRPGQQIIQAWPNPNGETHP